VLARCQWLKPISLATLEAEIRRITVGGQLRQIVCEILSENTQHKEGLAE
jgi:hypothetical protein